MIQAPPPSIYELEGIRPVKINKPPIGLMPLRFWQEGRQQDIKEAIVRYTLSGLTIPQEWVEELRTLNATLI